MNVDQLLSAITALGPNEKAELVGKLSASAEKKTTILTLRAAAARADNKNEFRQMMARAERLGVAHLIELDKPIDVFALNMALKGKDLSERLVLKSELFIHKMIPA